MTSLYHSLNSSSFRMGMRPSKRHCDNILTVAAASSGNLYPQKKHVTSSAFTWVWHRGQTFLSGASPGVTVAAPTGGRIAGPGGGVGGGPAGTFGFLRARRNAKRRNRPRRIAIRTATMIASGDWRVRLMVRVSLAWAPNGSSTSTRTTTSDTAMSGVVQRTDVLPTPFVRIGIVWLPMVTLTHTWRYRVRKTSSDIVQESVTAPAAGSACPFVGIVIATVGGPFAGSPGSIPIVKSDGWFVSVQLATRSRI